ncbi:putative cystathionine gamma-synthase [Fusarium oxysporum f. sp. albedinis]|nr:putative cystathionine gamma-synthase [Fusarium oxysporum f. sp. albedinis]
MKGIKGIFCLWCVYNLILSSLPQNNIPGLQAGRPISDTTRSTVSWVASVLCAYTTVHFWVTGKTALKGGLEGFD